MTNCTAITASGDACTRPTSDRLCPHHLDELLRALRKVAGDPIADRREADRTADKRLRHDLERSQLIATARAATDADEQRRILRGALGRRVQQRPEAHGQGLWQDLQDAVAGRVQLGSGTPTATPATEVRIPVNLSASDLAHALDNTVSTWFRDVVGGEIDGITTTVAAADWLAQHPALLRSHPAADELHDEITAIVAEVARRIDTSPDRLYLGICGAWVGDDEHEYDVHQCGATLHAWPGQPVATCRTCRTRYDVAERRDWMLGAAEEQLLTAVDCARALSGLGEHVSVNTIRSWAARDGRLTQREPADDDPRRRPRYRLGDVLDLALAREVA